MAYRHDASAAAFGGFLTRPFNQPITTQASSVLSPVGGYASARVENYRFREIVSFDAGYTQVIGTQHENRQGQTVYETLASTVVEGLNILDMITADRVVARLTSEYVEGESGDEPPYFPIGSYFVNLRVAGTRIGDERGVLEPRPYLLDTKTGEKNAGKKAIVEMLGRRNCRPFCDAAGHEISSLPPKARLPLFDLSTLQIPGVEKQAEHGCTIEIPTFGTVILGEFLVEAGRRTLNMIVVELHSPEAGMVALGPVQGNGSPN